MGRRFVLLIVPLLALAGCAGQGPVSDGVRSDTVALELDQDTAEGSPLAGDGENCLAIEPEDQLSSVTAEITWDAAGDAPDRLHLLLHEVEGGTTRSQSSGAPGASVSANGIDTKITLAVQLPENSDATAENLTVEMSYTFEGGDATVSTATCKI